MIDVFYYGRDCSVSPKIWAIFAGLQDAMAKYDSSDFRIEHIDDIYRAAVDGKIDMSKPFNLAAYEFAIQHRDKLNKKKQMRDITFISFADSDTERDADLRSGGVSVDVASYRAEIFADVKSDFDQLFDNEELKYAIEQIKQLNDDMAVNYGVDLIVLLKQAVLTESPEAKSKIKEVCSKFSVVAEQVKIILSSGVPIQECFG